MKKRINSFRYALKGIAEGFRGQINIKLQLLATLAVIALGYWIHLKYTEWGIVLFCCALVLSLELLNTAIEKLCDFIEPRQNEKIRVIKDISAGAVLVASLFSLVIGLLIFVPKIVDLFTD